MQMVTSSRRHGRVAASVLRSRRRGRAALARIRCYVRLGCQLVLRSRRHGHVVGTRIRSGLTAVWQRFITVAVCLQNGMPVGALCRTARCWSEQHKNSSNCRMHGAPPNCFPPKVNCVQPWMIDRGSNMERTRKRTCTAQQSLRRPPFR